jgi:hemerythrin-like metal-binding protein
MHGFVYTHFTDEELFMIDIDFPELEEHIQIHCDIRTQMNDIKKQLEETHHEEKIKPLIDQIFKSYTNHIQNTDIKFINYYKNAKPSAGREQR